MVKIVVVFQGQRSGLLMRNLSCIAVAICACSIACDTGYTTDSGESVLELATTPQFRVSGGIWSGDSLFYHRVAGGRFTSDGRVAVTLRQQGMVAFLDSAGVLVSVVGRRGQGPGEFQSLTRLYEYGGNRIAAWDPLNRRVSILRGSAIETEFAMALPPQHEVIGFLNDGTVVSGPSPIGPHSESWVVGQPVQYLLWSPTGQAVDTLTGLPAIPFPQFALEMTGDGRPRRTILDASDCLPVRHVALADNRIVIADAVTGTLMRLTQNGEKQILYQAGELPRLEEAFLDSIRARIDLTEQFYGSAATAESKRVISEQLGPVGGPVPSVWRHLIMDSAGRLWLQRATGCWPAADESSVWDIVDQHEGPLGSLNVPGNLRILAIADDEILIVETDALGVEWVSVYDFKLTTH